MRFSRRRFSGNRNSTCCGSSVAGTLRVPSAEVEVPLHLWITWKQTPPLQLWYFRRRSLRHTECAYYFRRK
jgi:hypothetical protein